MKPVSSAQQVVGAHHWVPGHALLKIGAKDQAHKPLPEIHGAVRHCIACITSNAQSKIPHGYPTKS